jgi:Holliday junction resolvase
VQDAKGRWHSFGLAVGSADLIGFQTVEVTPDMVGKKVAVFVSIECKSATGKTRPEQEAWARTVQSKGGKAVIARSVEEAQAGLK